MKRTVQMSRSGVPSAGMRPYRFKGWRKQHWHDIRILEGFDAVTGLPIHRYEPMKVAISRPLTRRIALGRV